VEKVSQAAREEEEDPSYCDVVTMDRWILAIVDWTKGCRQHRSKCHRQIFF
jgi:hypothetical protein